MPITQVVVFTVVVIQLRGLTLDANATQKPVPKES